MGKHAYTSLFARAVTPRLARVAEACSRVHAMGVPTPELQAPLAPVSWSSGTASAALEAERRLMCEKARLFGTMHKILAAPAGEGTQCECTPLLRLGLLGPPTLAKHAPHAHCPSTLPPAPRTHKCTAVHKGSSFGDRSPVTAPRGVARQVRATRPHHAHTNVHRGAPSESAHP